MKNSQVEKDQQNATVTSLNLQQYQAIELLLIGKSDVEVGQLVGVESDTVWQWRNKSTQLTAPRVKRAVQKTSLVNVSRF